MIIYVKNNIPCKRRTDLEVNGVESVLLEIRFKNKTVILCNFHRPPNSTIDVNNKTESSINVAYDTSISNIVIAGDFNYNYSNITSRRKAAFLFDPYRLVQFIGDPSYFTNNLGIQYINLLLTGNVSSVVLSGVSDAFLDQNIRYHWPIYLNFDKYKQFCYKITIWKNDLLKQYVLIGVTWTNYNINIYDKDVTSKIL